MKKYEQIIIKQEFDHSIKYLDKQDLTTAECMQEIGHLRNFIYQLYLKNPEK